MNTSLHFNLLKTIDNEAYPAYVKLDGTTYLLKNEKSIFLEQTKALNSGHWSSVVLHDFTRLSDEQKLEILTWRNSEAVRAYMYNAHQISVSEHFNFMESLKTRNDKRYFLVECDGKKIGVIDFNDISPTSALMGLYANPHTKGFGSVLMYAILFYAQNALKIDTLQAEVFLENERAKRLYDRFGFSEISRKEVNNKKVFCMELQLKNAVY